MANNDDNNPRRNPNRPEDNPFIAFRRFADSQVSSLLNTVFTLPTTIANYNNAYQAREQCLFGKADERQCDKLSDIEAETAELRHKGRELFMAGDVQAALKNGSELLKLEQRSEELRRGIMEDAGERNGQKDTELVHKVANEKGQEWGDSWDWGFPRPFDLDSKMSGKTGEDKKTRETWETEAMLRLQAEVQKLVAAFDGNAWDDPPKEVANDNRHLETRAETREPRVWSWSRSWQWPPPADASRSDDSAYSPRVLENDQEMKRTGVQWRDAYEDLLRAERSENSHCVRSNEHVAPGRKGRMELFSNPKWAVSNQERHDEPRWHDEPSYEYSHDHEDQHDDPPTPKMDQRFPLVHRRPREDRDRMFWEDNLEPRQEREQGHLAQLGKDAQTHNTTSEMEEEQAETELDVYEQMDAAAQVSDSASSAIPKTTATAPLSILSTLTTTERTVATDGSITTKVVLKKRFADGREESTETVHTQRGQDEHAGTREQDPWKAMQNAQCSLVQESAKKQQSNDSKKTQGWFWSS